MGSSSKQKAEGSLEGCKTVRLEAGVARRLKTH
jgi:hypothetical protein